MVNIFTYDSIFQDPRGASQEMDLSCVPPDAMMVQEAEKPRAV
jgi:hypothetical protein